MNIYVVCPVALLTDKEKALIDSEVDNWEEQGHNVRLPYRDTDQEDAFGMRIIEEHEDDIIWADEVRVWYNRTSTGSFWDIGQTKMAQYFLPNKRLRWVNVDEVDLRFYEQYQERIISNSIVKIRWNSKRKICLWRMGQARMARIFQPTKHIVVTNAYEVALTPSKSYTNVAIGTHLGMNSRYTRNDLVNLISRIKSK